MDYVTYKEKQYKIDEYGRLILSGLDIEDISEIKGLDKLQNVISLSLQNNKISEVKGFEKLLELETLYLYYNEISEIKNLGNLINLKQLVLRDNKITEIKGLDTLTNLIELNLSNNEIEKIEGLEELVNLEHLNLHGNKIKEIMGLESLINLRTLYLNSNEITEIKGINTLSKLKRLYLDDNKIKEIKDLEDLKDLKYLRIDENPIPSKTIEDLGGLNYGAAVKPQAFVEYCLRQKEIEAAQQEEKESKELIIDDTQKERVKTRIANNISKLSQLKNKWQEFLQKDTYLTYELKFDFIDQLKDLLKFPWYYHLTHSSKLKTLKENINNFEGQINNYNDEFVKNRLEEYSSFFDGEESPLDSDQRLAVMKDDKHNLVIAGAGSGKTSVITNRIAYLVKRKDNIEKNKILALAYTNVAAKEMRERLLKTYNIDIAVSTFHALGRSIIQEETNRRPKLITEGDSNKKFELIFYRLLQQAYYQEIFLEYLLYHSEEELEEENFEEKELYFKYMRNKQYSTLNNIKVKSISERDIGNFLFRYKIEFQYEPLAKWVDESAEEKEYHPDFYLPEYDIYIEHWGLNRDLEVSKWFTISSEEYRANREWKLTQFKKYQKVLIETWEYEHQEGILMSKLNEKLLKANPDIKFIPRDYNELVNKTFEFDVKKADILGLITSFIQIAKSNFLIEEDIARRILSRKYTRKQKLFGQLALEVYKEYQRILRSENKIDFNDMINLAVELIKRNPVKYLNRYDHILIDEFQDISYQRMELINCFVNDKSNTKLFCVGDDWQSIYQFTGSDVMFFVNFEQYFPVPELSYLNRNYRSAQNIVGISNSLIANNRNQINKKAYSKAGLDIRPLVYFEFSQRLTDPDKIKPLYIFHLIKKLLDEGAEPDEIMVISRFNQNLRNIEIFCGANKIPIEEERSRGKTKGVRFYSTHKSKGSESKYVIITDLTSGMYGFPCEIQDSSVFEVTKRFVTKSFIEEERRLFYVALTRSKQYLFLFSIQDNRSMFLDEITPHIRKIVVHSDEVWEKIISEYIPKVLKGFDTTSEQQLFCPECGGILVEHQGRHGIFLGCTGYPQCKYTVDLTEGENALLCPDCGARLIVRDGKYGKFMSCIGYPKCRFTFKLSKKVKSRIVCPKCRSPLIPRDGKYGRFLGCTNYPNCKFTFNI